MYTMVDNSQRTKDTVTAEDSGLLQIQMALNRLETDFSQIYSPIYFSSEQNKKLEKANSYQPTERFPKVTKEGHPVPLFEHPDDETLVFMTSSHRRKMEDVKQSRWAWVQYTVEDFDSDEDSGSSKMWVRRSIASNPFAPEVYWDKIRPQILVKNIESVRFLFWNARDKEWVENFPSIEGKLYAVKVELVWFDADSVEQSNTRVFRVLWPHPNFFFNLLQGVE